MKSLMILISLVATSAALAAGGSAMDGLLSGYREAGAADFSAERGRELWTRSNPAPDGGAARSCTSCHPADSARPGQHASTGEAIEPMSPVVSSARFTDPAHVEKWFKRNCYWTLGRTCTPQEKGDVIEFIRSSSGGAQ